MTLHILRHTQILEHIPTTLAWVTTGEDERENGRRKYTEKGHKKPDDDNELFTECNYTRGP